MKEDVIYIQSAMQQLNPSHKIGNRQKGRQRKNLEYVLTHEDTAVSQRVHCQIEALKCYHMITFSSFEHILLRLCIVI